MQIPPKPSPIPPAVKHPTIAGMPDRTAPEWGKPKPQPTVKTGAGELAPIPKHPAQMTEGELHERYFSPGYSFDTATGKSTEPFFAQPGHLLESPTRETPPQSYPAASAPVRPSPGLWGSAAPAPAPVPQRPKPDPSAEEAPLLSHERFGGSAAAPETDRFAGFEGWGRNAGQGGRGDYFGSDWD